jgi:hypothetical protein
LLDKLAVTDNADIEFLKELKSCTKETFNAWRNYFSAFSRRPKLVKAFSKFSAKCLEEIVVELGRRYEIETVEKSEKEDKYNKADLERIFSIILLAFRLVPADKKAEALVVLKKQEQLGKVLTSHYKSMLMGVDSAKSTTAALIFLDPAIEFVFYLRDSDKDRTLLDFSSFNFYHKCPETVYKEYLCNLKLFHSHCPNLEQHLKIVSNSLLEAECWERLASLLRIQVVQKHLTVKLLNDFYLTSNRSRRLANQVVKEIISSLFVFYKEYGIEWNEQLFVAAYFLDYVKAFETMKPEQLTFGSARRCAINHPEGAASLLGVNLTAEAISNKVDLRLMLPFMKHYVHDYPREGWLIDEVRLESRLAQKTEMQVHPMTSLRKVWKSHPAMVKYWDELYESREGMESQICQDILNDRSVSTIDSHS